jgi:ribosomal-protein-alanine N-acetyltransferase
VLYRLFRPDDFSQLYAIEQACFQPPARFPRRYMRQLIDRPNSATWIAEEGDQMSGFAIVEWSRVADQTVAYVQTLEVAPENRKLGIARELLRRIEGSAAAAGAQALWLHVAEQNAAAISLYEAHGYLPTGREEDYYAEGLPALIYAKPLEPRQVAFPSP